MRQHHWHRHPNVANDLTLGQRAADRLRNSMGSWWFVFGFVLFMFLWALLNTLAVVFTSWDPYPFILLNLMLSTLAGLQGAILLIAAKRQDQIASELALHDYRADVAARRNTELIKAVLLELHEHVTGRKLPMQALLEEIDQEIARQDGGPT